MAVWCWMLTAAGLGRAQPGGVRAVVLGAASTSHRQTEGLSGVRQKLLLFPLGCCCLSSVCPVSCAAGAVPGPGGAALGHGGAGPRLRLLPCPVPLGPSPSERAPAQVLPVPSRRPLVTRALCQHRGCAWAAAHERRDGDGRAHPALAALCRGGAGPWLVKKGPIHGWHRAVIQHARSRAKPPCSWLPGTWGEPRAAARLRCSRPSASCAPCWRGAAVRGQGAAGSRCVTLQPHRLLAAPLGAWSESS